MQSGGLLARERGVSALAIAARVERLCDNPVIVRLPRLLSPDLCDGLIASARPRLAPSLVEHRNGRAIVNRDNRRSESADIGGEHGSGHLIAEVVARLALEPEALLDPHVVRYDAGGFFKPHYDYACVHDTPVARRAASFVCFLNSDFEGGELEFSLAGVCASAARGDTIAFDNIDAEHSRIEASLHAGRAVLSGEKWILVFWSRQRLGSIFEGE